MKCPYCDYDNLDGADLCKRCGADLGGLDLPHHLADRTTRPFYEVTLADLSPAQAITLPATATAAEAIDQMREKGHGAVFIVEDDRLIGIFTERDALTKLALGERDIRTVRLGEVMTRNPDSLKPDAPMGQALNMMAVHGYRHVPVVDDMNRPVGFVSVRGALSYLHRHVLAR